MLALYCPFGVQGTWSSSQLDTEYRHWHDDQCSLVTFADQPSNRKQKYLFHRDPPCFENKRSAQQDWKWEKKWLDIYDVDVHSNAPASQSKAAILFSLFKPSGFFMLQLNLSWRHSRSSFAWPLFFQLRPLQAWLASGAHSKAVGSTSASEGTGRFQSVKIDRTASLLKLRSTISLCSTIYWQFHLWLGKGKCEESSLLGKHEEGRSGC